MLPRVLGGFHLAGDTPVPEAAGDQDAIDLLQMRLGTVLDQLLRVDPRVSTRASCAMPPWVSASARLL